MRDGIPVALYSGSKVVKSLAKQMTVEEAYEYFDFNILGAHVGDRTPVFLEDPDYWNDDDA
jgi:hypothetical protein